MHFLATYKMDPAIWIVPGIIDNVLTSSIRISNLLGYRRSGQSIPPGIVQMGKLMSTSLLRRALISVGASVAAIAAAATITVPANANDLREIVCSGSALMPRGIDAAHVQYGLTVDCTGGRPEIVAANTVLKKIVDGKVSVHSSKPNEIIDLDANNHAEVWYTASCSLTNPQLGFFYTEVTLGAIGGGGSRVRQITPSNSLPIQC
ncbi:hypothetical protein [Nocardia sp. NPDC056100]|uniref:hypothetical protein n=1 Tax=Nocardia sp. NPDC056100 TaxID=3345712 RepID=UPI0035DD21C7